MITQFTAQHTQMTAERLERVAALVSAGHVQAQIGHRFTLDDAVSTLAAIEGGTIPMAGKAVMTIKP